MASNVIKFAESSNETQVQVNTVNYTWKINNFKYVKTRSGEGLKSTDFPEGDSKNKWYAKLYPYSLLDYSFVSVIIFHQDILKPDVMTTFTLSIIDVDGQPTNINDRYEYIYGGIGFYQFIKKSTLESNSKNLPGGNLTLHFEISMATTNNLNYGQIKVPPCHIIKDLESLFKSQKFSDVTLTAGNQKFCCHKAILSARSPVFSAMFSHDMKENTSNKVSITDIDGQILKEMLCFIYTGSVSNLKLVARKLLPVADKYEIDRLKAMCEDEIWGNINTNNVVDLLIFADAHSTSQLKSNVIDFIKANATVVMNTTAWKRMNDDHPHLVNAVTKSKKIKTNG